MSRVASEMDLAALSVAQTNSLELERSSRLRCLRSPSAASSCADERPMSADESATSADERRRHTPKALDNFSPG